MNKPSIIIADLHTHTIGSLHAFSTLKENIQSAKENMIQYIAVTDHLYYDPDDRCQRLNEVSRLTYGAYYPKDSKLNIIIGVEGNLGHIITDKKDCDALNSCCKWRLVGHHNWFLDPENKPVECLIEHFAETLRYEYLIRPTAFAHIERTIPLFKTDDKKAKRVLNDIVDIAVQNDIFLEINESSINKNSAELMKSWISYAKERKAKFCLGTDAHYCDMIGNFTKTEQLFETVDMSGQYILNCDKDALNQFLCET